MVFWNRYYWCDYSDNYIRRSANSFGCVLYIFAVNIYIWQHRDWDSLFLHENRINTPYFLYVWDFRHYWYSRWGFYITVYNNKEHMHNIQKSYHVINIISNTEFL